MSEKHLSEFCVINMGQSPKGEECNELGIGSPLLNGPTEFGRQNPVAVQWTINPKKKSKVGDILFCVRGSTTGRMNWSNIEYAIGRGLAAVSPKIPGTIHYFRALLEYRLPELLASATGSTFPNVSRSDLENIPVEISEISLIQNASKIFECIENKIEVNQEINQTLEDIAKATFKSWFIDFDPVRAKVEGKLTGLPDEINDLFPDEFVDSELGEIPKGWAVKTLKDIDLEIESGKRPKGGIDKDLIDGIPSVGAESIDTPGVFDFSKVKYVPEEFTFNVQKGWVKDYDVALYKDGAFVSKVSLYGDSFPFSKFMVNEHVFLLRSIKLGQFFLYRLFFSDLIKNQLIAMGTSKAVQPGLNQQEVASCTFICPTQKLSDYFNALVKPLVKKQLLLGKESQVLGSIRDALLLKLISGELQIPDAEKFIEEAGI